MFFPRRLHVFSVNRYPRSQQCIRFRLNPETQDTQERINNTDASLLEDMYTLLSLKINQNTTFMQNSIPFGHLLDLLHHIYILLHHICSYICFITSHYFLLGFITSHLFLCNIEQFRTISLLSVEGKVFFSIVSCHLTFPPEELPYPHSCALNIPRGREGRGDLAVLWIDLTIAYSLIPT